MNENIKERKKEVNSDVTDVWGHGPWGVWLALGPILTKQRKLLVLLWIMERDIQSKVLWCVRLLDYKGKRWSKHLPLWNKDNQSLSNKTLFGKSKRKKQISKGNPSMVHKSQRNCFYIGILFFLQEYSVSLIFLYLLVNLSYTKAISLLPFCNGWPNTIWPNNIRGAHPICIHFFCSMYKSNLYPYD